MYKSKHFYIPETEDETGAVYFAGTRWYFDQATGMFSDVEHPTNTMSYKQYCRISAVIDDDVVKRTCEVL